MKKFGAHEIVIGYNHAFGKDREGSIEALRMLGEEHDFNVTVIEPVEYNGQNISSTRIRKALQEGKVSQAAEMLGRSYALSGKVVKGKGIGKEISIPTANLEVNDERKLIPKNGIYIVKVLVEGNWYNGLINIGTNPTFDSHDLSLEVNIFDFNKDIYNQEISISFIEKIRDERKFADLSKLSKQLEQDKKAALKIINNKTSWNHQK